jgi:hypothetical protein
LAGTELEQIQRKYDALRAKLASADYICSGSVMLLFRKCGRGNCACHDSKKAEHGPYYIWTRKVSGKTVTRTLSEAQAKRCMKFIENLKKLDAVLEEMKGVAAEAVQAGP